MGTSARIVAVLGLLWVASAPRAEEPLRGQDWALRGLTAVAVMAGEVSPESLQAGVSVESLLAPVQDRVRRAGLGAEAAPPGPRLLLDLQTFHLRAAGLIAFSLTLALEETVELPRRPGTRVAARTWTASSVGTSLGGKFGEAVGGTAEALADRFVDDLALANLAR